VLLQIFAQKTDPTTVPSRATHSAYFLFWQVYRQTNDPANFNKI
jgi:hypothetical protein